MTLRECKQHIRQFIRTNWSDQKLCDVYAFNMDGHMAFGNPCSCLMGVTRADSLHVLCLGFGHYHDAQKLPGAYYAEVAYKQMGALDPDRYYPTSTRSGWDGLRRRRLSTILKAEMRRRARLRNELQAQFRIPLKPIKSKVNELVNA